MKIPVLYQIEKKLLVIRKSLKNKINQRKQNNISKKLLEKGIPPVLGFYLDRKKAIDLHKNDITMLVLGSSHGQQAVDPSLIPGCFNLSIASQDMYESYKLYEKYVKYLPKLQTIVLFFSVFSPGAEMQKTCNKQLCQYYKAVFDIDFKYPWTDKYYKKEIKWLMEHSSEIDPNYMGYEPIVGKFDYDVAYNDLLSHLKHNIRGNHQEHYVKKIFELAYKNNHRLVVVIPPHSPNYRKALKEECIKKNIEENSLFKSIYELREEFGFKLIDWFSSEIFTNEDFWDWEHLLPSGAKKFTKILKDSLIPIKLQSVILDISYYCNAKCPFCPRQILKPKLSGFMNDEIFYSSMKQIENIPSIKLITLAAEGEPLTHPKFDEYVKYIKSKNLKIAFPTNMSLAHKHYDSMLLCDYIMFSIEGWDKQSFEKLRPNLKYETVVKNIKTFSELVKQQKKKNRHAPEISINLIVTKETQVIKFIEQWKNYVDFIRIGPIGPNMNFDKNTKTIKPVVNQELKEIMLPLSQNSIKTCLQPFSLTVVKPNGKLGLCCSDYNIDLDFGNYKEIYNNFVNNKNLSKIRQEFENQELTICNDCPQHLSITRKEYEKYLPELRDIESKYNNVTVYALR